MAEFVRKTPQKVSIRGILSVLFAFGVMYLMGDSVEWRVITSVACITMLLVFLVRSFLAPFFGGVTLEDGRIETITDIGGVISIAVEEIDHDKSFLDQRGLLLVPYSGESIFISASEYSAEAILRVAKHAKLEGYLF